MYKSPIDMFVTDIMTQIEKQTDDEIYKAVASVGINVDKDELIRALRYDRQQYEAGFLAGKAAAMAEIEELKNEILILSQKRANIFEIINAYERGMIAGAKNFAEYVFSLFPEDKDFTTLSRFAIKQKLKEMVGDDNA